MRRMREQAFTFRLPVVVDGELSYINDRGIPALREVLQDFQDQEIVALV
jgi:hypothetical protein